MAPSRSVLYDSASLCDHISVCLASVCNGSREKY